MYTHTAHGTQMNTSKSRDLDMVWLWSAGSMKSYVSFAEYLLFYRALLQKRPII